MGPGVRSSEWVGDAAGEVQGIEHQLSDPTCCNEESGLCLRAYGMPGLARGVVPTKPFSTQRKAVEAGVERGLRR